ncbi:MAG TPA: GtrA family protein [Candidatus Poseidoniaceae archaeon]|nr:GtrA family protein [Candidatus Poseidoniaceae archaeon]
MDKTQLSAIAPRGTIRRFASAGAINTLLFWLFWEILRLSPALAYISETGVWAVAWVMSCTIAHFTHRYLTFDGRKDVKATMIGAFAVYAIGGVLSTLSYDILVANLTLPIRIIFIINMLISGLFTWATMRWFVFEYQD